MHDGQNVFNGISRACALLFLESPSCIQVEPFSFWFATVMAAVDATNQIYDILIPSLYWLP